MTIMADAPTPDVQFLERRLATMEEDRPGFFDVVREDRIVIDRLPYKAARQMAAGMGDEYAVMPRE
jgi:hypothetical protein